ncbi:MAG: hypothetical protein JW807_06035 [Spirochaetes bacterium]|nr:hypothetical protein [Spirochaetota bacterium]
MFRFLFFTIIITLVVASYCQVSAHEIDNVMKQPGGVFIAQNKVEQDKTEREKMRDELLLQSSMKSPVGAWAMSFFIGMFTPFLGSGQYYAQMYASAVPTMLVGFASFGCYMGGVFTNNMTLVIVGASIFGAAWIYDWIAAIVFTNKYNDRMREKFYSAGSIAPCLSFAVNPNANDNVIKAGLTYTF